VREGEGRENGDNNIPEQTSLWRGLVEDDTDFSLTDGLRRKLERLGKSKSQRHRGEEETWVLNLTKDFKARGWTLYPLLRKLVQERGGGKSADLEVNTETTRQKNFSSLGKKEDIRAGAKRKNGAEHTN